MVRRTREEWRMYRLFDEIKKNFDFYLYFNLISLKSSSFSFNWHFYLEEHVPLDCFHCAPKSPFLWLAQHPFLSQDQGSQVYLDFLSYSLSWIPMNCLLVVCLVGEEFYVEWCFSTHLVRRRKLSYQNGGLHEVWNGVWLTCGDVLLIYNVRKDD